MCRDLKNLEVHHRKSLECLELTVAEIRVLKDASGKGWEGKEEHVVGN